VPLAAIVALQVVNLHCSATCTMLEHDRFRIICAGRVSVLHAWRHVRTDTRDTSQRNERKRGTVLNVATLQIKCEGAAYGFCGVSRRSLSLSPPLLGSADFSWAMPVGQNAEICKRLFPALSSDHALVSCCLCCGFG
jgi:hypothetical protein